MHQNGDKYIQFLRKSRFTALLARRRKTKFRPYIRRYTSPNENFEYSYPVIYCCLHVRLTNSRRQHNALPDDVKHLFVTVGHNVFAVTGIWQISTLYQCTGRRFNNSTPVTTTDLGPLNNMVKRILKKWREPTILENSRLGFIESVHEN